jgi:hypothetical protein
VVVLIYPSFQVVNESCTRRDQDTHHLFDCLAKPIASMTLPLRDESIIAIAYPSLAERIERRFNVLGIDQLMRAIVDVNLAQFILL